MGYPHKLWMSSRLNRRPHTIWRIKTNYIVEIPKQWRMELSQSRLWHLKFQKRYKEMETKLSMSVMQNLLATCWFYIIIMCGTGIKEIFLFFILSIICYIIDVFLFLLYFSPLKGRYWHRNKMVSWFITVMNLQTVLYLSFSRVLLGGWR